MLPKRGCFAMETEIVLKLSNNADIVINIISESLTWCCREYQAWVIKCSGLR